MEKNTISTLQELSGIIGIAGDEKQVSAYMQARLQACCDEIVYDHLGSMFAVKRCGKTNAKRVMVCAHMDEVGLMINELHANGLASFIKIGLIPDAALYASKVSVKTREGIVAGVICGEEEAVEKTDVKKMKIDFGVKDEQGLKALGVRVGDSAVLAGKAECFAKRMIGKALDSRSGCALAIELMEALKDCTLDFDLYVGASVMEEVGQRGAVTATGLIHPDLGIVLDGGAAGDYAGKENAVGQLGKGVLVRYYDKGMMPNRALLDQLVDVCEKQEIDHQYYYTMTLSDAAWVHKLFTGCPTLHVGIAARNVHTGAVMIDLHDYDCAKKAALAVIETLDEQAIAAYQASNR